MNLGLRTTAVLVADYRRGSRRAFWLGLSLFGRAYWLMSFGRWFDTWAPPDLLLRRPGHKLG